MNCNIGDVMDITTDKPEKHFKTIELFAGTGGLALGIEKAGFDNVAVVIGGIIEAEYEGVEIIKH